MILLVSALCSSAVAQLPPVVAKSPDNVAAGAVGDMGAWDLSATDCTFKAGKNEVWIVDSHSEDVRFIVTFRAANLGRHPGL